MMSASLDSASSALLSHLSLLFVPAGVGMMIHFDRIAQEWVPITVYLSASPLVGLTITLVAYSIEKTILERAEFERYA